MKKSELIEKINAFVATIFPQDEKKEELKEEVINMGAPVGNKNAAGPHNKRHADMPGLNNPYRKGSKKYVEHEKRIQKAYYPKKVGRPKVNMEEDINNIELMEIEIGNAFPDGEYNINGDIVTLLNGVVTEIIPEEEKSEEKPAEETVVEEEMKKEEIKPKEINEEINVATVDDLELIAAEEFIIGQPIPDGQYDLGDIIIIIANGVVESIEPIKEDEEVEEGEEESGKEELGAPIGNQNAAGPHAMRGNERSVKIDKKTGKLRNPRTPHPYGRYKTGKKDASGKPIYKDFTRKEARARWGGSLYNESEVKINLEDERNKIRLELEAEYVTKLDEVKKEFNEKIDKLAETAKGSGIIQAPVVIEEKPFKPLSNAEYLVKTTKK